MSLKFTRIVQSVMVVALVFLYLYGDRIAVRAMFALHAGTESGPLDDHYPVWTAIHFTSAFVFATLAILQLQSAIRRNYLAIHRVTGRVAVTAGLIAAASGTAIPLLLPARPIAWRIYVLGHLAVTAWFLLTGFRSARIHDIPSHERWMIRTVASAGSVMTQRIIFPVFPIIFRIQSDTQFWHLFLSASVSALFINLFLAECWIHLDRERRPVAQLVLARQ